MDPEARLASPATAPAMANGLELEERSAAWSLSTRRIASRHTIVAGRSFVS